MKNRATITVENMPPVASSLAYIIEIVEPDGYREAVNFLMLRNAVNKCCWLLLDDYGVPRQHGEFFCDLPDALRLAKKAARRWHHKLCEREAAYDRRTDAEEYQRRCDDNIRGVGPNIVPYWY